MICSSVSYELFPNVHENGGIGYQFLYEGDELKCYEHGLLIESVE
ncbi:upfA domain protein [Escherichia coli 2-156-04_S1_C3]|nr:upfA domain protein [Escherichia coli 2-156-04_S1_C3]